MRTLIGFTFVLVVGAASSAANAVTCYTLLDRSDKLLYQNSLPPVDMSPQGVALREGLRRRNEYLLVAEVDRCQSVAAVAGTAGYRPATVDEIVNEMGSYLSYGGGGIPAGPLAGESLGGGAAGGSSAAPAASPGASSGARRSY